MRNAFGTSPQRGSGFAADNDPVFAERASSLDQTAVVWSHSGEVVAASPLASGAGIYEIDVARFPTEFNLGAALNMRRASHSNVPPLSQESLFLTTLPIFRNARGYLHWMAKSLRSTMFHLPNGS